MPDISVFWITKVLNAYPIVKMGRSIAVTSASIPRPPQITAENAAQNAKQARSAKMVNAPSIAKMAKLSVRISVSIYRAIPKIAANAGRFAMRTKKKSAPMANANCAVTKAYLSAMPLVSIPRKIPNTAVYAAMPVNRTKAVSAANASPIVCAALRLAMASV
jgi:hypothetical protein